MKMLLSSFELTCLKGTTTPNQNVEVEQFAEVELFPSALLTEISGPLVKKSKKRKLTMSESASPAIVPHENDVLMGRGGKNNQHVGNEKLREFARLECDNYRRSSKKGKSYISRALVMKVRELKPPGRFLKRNQLTSDWEDVGDEIAREKASQVLRDAVAGQGTGTSTEDNDNPIPLDLEQTDPDLEQKPRHLEPEQAGLAASERFSHSESEIGTSSSFHFERSRTTSISEHQDRPRSASTPISIGRGHIHAAARPHPDEVFDESAEYAESTTPIKHPQQPDHRSSYPPVTPISTSSNKKRRRQSFGNPQSISFERYASTTTRTPDNPGMASLDIPDFSGNREPYTRQYPEYHQYHHPHRDYHERHQQRQHQPQQQHHRQQYHHQPQHHQQHHREHQRQQHQRQYPHHHQRQQQHMPHHRHHQHQHQYHHPHYPQQQQHQHHQDQHVHRPQHHGHQRHYRQPQPQSPPHPPAPFTPPRSHYDVESSSYGDQRRSHQHDRQASASQLISTAISAESSHSFSSHGLLDDMQENMEEMQEQIGEFDLFEGGLLDDPNDREGSNRENTEYGDRGNI